MTKEKKTAKRSVRTSCTRRAPARVAATLEIPREEVTAPLRRSPRPGSCSKFVRREIAAAMPTICAMLLSRTMEGDLSALKLLLQMALNTDEQQQAGKRQSSGFARKVLESFKDWEARETELKRDC